MFATVSLPLPSESTFTQDIYNLAWPQILLYSSAILGLFACTLIIKSFVK